jgi:hypothetical protein
MELSSDQNTIILLVIIIILAILLYKIYTNHTSHECFTSTSGMANDLLTKLKSYDAQATNATNPADLELSIYPWTTKLYNLQAQNQVKAIGLYKPHLSINGIQYAKLGDMISQNTDYSPPDNKETTLLISKVGSDIKTPIDYSRIVKMGNTSLPRYYYQLNNLISANLPITSVIGNIQGCANSMLELNSLIINNDLIVDGIINKVYNSAFLKIGNSNPITLATLNSMPRASTGIIAVNITHETKIIVPVGVSFAIYANNNGRQQVIGLGNWSNFNYRDIMTIDAVLDALNAGDNRTLQNLSASNIINNHYIINAFSFIDQTILITYLNNLCNHINAILSLPGLSQDFANYINLADSVDSVNRILAALSTITIPEDNLDNSGNKINLVSSNNILRDYASTNSGTLLGGILNLIKNYTIDINYPSMELTANALKINQTITQEITNFNNLVNSTNLFQVSDINPNILRSISYSITSNDDRQLVQTIISNNIPNLSNLMQFTSAISSNTIEYFPLQIYAPVAPTGYQSLGHVFCNVDRDITKIKTMNNIACVPSGCVKEVRDWASADKVFEYNRNGVYWAIYKNPYVGTFVAVSKPGLPEGKVCKVVACVAKCTAVDELKKADKCARTYQALNKDISRGDTSLPDLVASTEENIYLQKIKTQNDSIITLQNRARQLQTDIDKADVITAEMNKVKLQNYVDTQKRNIELVADQLERDQNKIQANINIPVQVLNQLITMINNLPNLNANQKTALVSKIVSNAQAANSGLLTSDQYNANLNNILRSCPQYDLTGLVPKSVVGDVCYGCGTPS